MTTPGKILVIEDEAHIRKFLRLSLEACGYAVHEARLAAEGLERCAGAHPDLVILELKLPDMDGMFVIRGLREWCPVPIIVLSARTQEADKVAALDAGANDYVTKPFGIAELMARIRAVLRNYRSPEGPGAAFETQGLHVDLSRRKVTLDGKQIRLTRKEYALLRLLISAPGRAFGHEEILHSIWGSAHLSSTHYVRVLVGQLRNKLGDDSARPRFIQTEPGIGYRLLTQGA